ncbi:MAG: hypothetical protein LBT47_01150 [Deltaproteobacteria bacterium]|jgi:lysozyme family protein|nr:hypothetical protein [Deltaproteobacteria bacterium]
MSFETVYFGHTKNIEGGYANDVKDKAGGETYKGVSRLNHPKWPGWQIVDRIKAELGLTNTLGKISTWKSIDTLARREYALEEMVVEFYRQEYYAPYQKVEIPQRLRDKMFDTAVNTGHKNAVKILQRAINCLMLESEWLKYDGVLGPKTLGKIGAVPFDKLLKRYAAYHRHHYERWLASPKGIAYWPQREAFYARARWLPEEDPS